MARRPDYYRPMPNITDQEARDQYRFTCGDCHILAKTLHRITGWRLATFGFHGQPDCHAFVICPDGDVLDVDGKRSWREFCEHWGYDPTSRESDPLVWASPAALNKHWDVPTFGDYSYKRAKQIAGRLLAQVGWEG